VLEPFLREYRQVRGREQRRRASADYYRMLPAVPVDDPHAWEWQIRRETYGRLLRRVFADGPSLMRVLDLGAGSAWLSHRLAELGHHTVAVDVLDDDADGLGAARHYASRFPAVQADFNALPFLPHQFDLVVFNGSLHYAHDVGDALARAHDMLASGGALVVMDSPMFHSDGDGRAMTTERARRFQLQYGLASVVRAGAGYLTFPSLEAAAQALQLQSAFVPSRGPFGWRMRRRLAYLRLRRAPAAFGLWVAR
jgi:SAM-dependent methyltransferase